MKLRIKNSMRTVIESEVEKRVKQWEGMREGA